MDTEGRTRSGSRPSLRDPKDCRLTAITTDSFRLTVEQALSLGKGQAGRRQIRSMAAGEKWLRCGRAGARLWAEYPVANREPIRVQFDLENLTVCCSCSSRQRPCNHGPALYLRWLQMPEAFQTDSPPAWLQQTAAGASPENPTPSAKWVAVEQGLSELELWLHDLIRAGLAGLPAKPATFWQSISHRLADAHLVDLARSVKELAKIPGAAPDWPETLLIELGRLHLQIQAFRQWDSLSPAVQGDLRAAVGWLDADFLAAGNSVTDRWQIVADERRPESSQTIQRIWLWAEGAKRPALVVRHLGAFPGRPSATSDWLLPTGVGVAGAFMFYPATTEIRAEPAGSIHFYQPETAIVGYTALAEALEAFRTALTGNPWLREWPLLLHGMRAARISERWRLVDDAGETVPFVEGFDRGWHLRALHGDPQTRVFGLWNGVEFQPLSIWSDGSWLQLEALRAIK